MSESFVDLSYRGLVLGKRIKLTQVRAAAAYLEMPAPMPVGTTIGIATEDGVLLEATVTAIHEQVLGADRAPGMTVTPKLEADPARTWWKDRVSLTEAPQVPAADADGKVTVRSRRMTGEGGVPELVDDGRNTAVMDAIDDAQLAPAAGQTDPSLPRISAELAAQVPIVDDGKRTMMMDAVDLEALGLEPSASASSMPAVTDEDSGGTSGNGNGNGDKAKSKKKRKKR